MSLAPKLAFLNWFRVVYDFTTSNFQLDIFVMKFEKRLRKLLLLCLSCCIVMQIATDRKTT